jgi:hypothetical protein
VASTPRQRNCTKYMRQEGKRGGADGPAVFTYIAAGRWSVLHALQSG